MFFMINQNNVKIKLFISYLFFGFISTAKAEKNLTSTVTDFLANIIQLPQINVTENGVDFICPGTGPTSSLEEYTSFFSQVGTFIPIAGLLFTIAVYGAKSVFGIMTTCLIDDIVIATTSFAPIFWWYTFAKPLWFYGIIHEIQGDLIYDKDLINSITIGVLFGIMIILQIFGAIVRFHFHQCRNELNKDSIWFQMLPKNLHVTNKEFFGGFKDMFIWGYFLHSVEVIVYSFLTYKYIFSTYFKQFDQLNSDHGSKLRHIIFLIWKDLSLVKVDVLVALCVKGTVFNTILTIVLTRSIASFFSDGGVIECTYKHGGDEKVYAEIKVKNINELNYEYDEKEQLKKLKDKKFKKFFLKVKKYLFGKGVFESGPILKEIKKITGADATCPLKHHNLKVKKMGVENKVRINILETGALNYFIYSHRKNSEEEDEQKEQKEQKEKYVFEISEFHKKC
ncbi:9333_t:CDS:2 [Entrophospora sp. SA101]|nr:9333_t:CDS:2 [Entrophospora sp. SA101]CAJ0907178.1 6630_t:CDS:2 [Entrophospora sp. SA101]